jgi:hypothetical protein
MTSWSWPWRFIVFCLAFTVAVLNTRLVAFAAALPVWVVIAVPVLGFVVFFCWMLCAIADLADRRMGIKK